MTRLLTFLMSGFMLGAAHAMEVHDAPIPEPNYLGILIFLILFFGGSGWYMWHIMTKDKRDKQNKLGHAK